MTFIDFHFFLPITPGHIIYCKQNMWRKKQHHGKVRGAVFLVFGGESESFLDWLEIQGNAHLVEAVHADALLVGGQ